MLRYLTLTFLVLLVIVPPCHSNKDPLEPYDSDIQLLLRDPLTLANLQSGYLAQLQNLALNSQINFNKFVIEDVVADDEGLRAVLDMRMGPSLTKFRWIGIEFTEQMMKSLFSHAIVYERFTSLELSRCNVFDEDFTYVQARPSQIEIIDFEDLPISTRAYQGLAKMSMRLRHLALDRCSLVKDEAVDAVISFGLSNLEYLDLEATQISANNLLRVLKQTSPSKLKSLKIGVNYYDLSFYDQFIKLNLSTLTRLSLAGLQIPDEGFEILARTKFPKLETLVLSYNQMTNQMMRKFLTKQRFPALTSLDLTRNYINDTALDYLRMQGFTFKDLTLFFEYRATDTMLKLSRMNLRQLASLDIESPTAQDQEFQGLISSIDETKISQLTIRYIFTNLYMLEYFCKKKWYWLQYLELPDVYTMQDFNNKCTNDVIFPVLNELTLSASQASLSDVRKFVLNIHKLAPNLHTLRINSQRAAGVIADIIDGKNVISGSALELTIMTQSPIPSIFKVKLAKNKSPQIIYLDMFMIPLIYALAKGGINLSNLGDVDWPNIDISSLDIGGILELVFGNGDGSGGSVVENVVRNTDLKALEVLKETGQLGITELLLGINRKGGYSYRNLKELHFLYQGANQNKYNLFKNCNFPVLQHLEIFGNNNPDDLLELQFLIKKVPFLSSIIIGSEAKIPSLKQFFRKSRPEYLTSIVMVNARSLDSADLQEIQSYIPNFQRVRRIDYSFTFINKDLGFMGRSGIRPELLVLNGILFTQNALRQLCQVQFQFIKAWSMNVCGINDKSMMGLLNCIEDREKNKNNTVFFPMLKSLSLSNNHLGTQSIRKIMALGLPSIEQLLLQQNMDYEIFNSIFSSPYARNISMFTTNLRYFYGIDPSIDSNIVSRLIVFQINSAYLRESDFIVLSRLKFYSIQNMNLQLKGIEGCEILKSILNMCRGATFMTLAITDSPTLNSKCITGEGFQGAFSSVRFLQLSSDNYLGEMENFANLLWPLSETARSIQIKNIKMDQKKLLDFWQSQILNNLLELEFQSCGITDEFAQAVFSHKSFSWLANIDLSGNQITAEGLRTIAGRQTRNLQTLDLSSNFIGDQGIKYFVNATFPKLMQLSLSNIDMTREGLKTLCSMKNAKNLMGLDISNNNLTYEDLKLINIANFPLLQVLVVFPSLKFWQVLELQQSIESTRRSLFGGVQLRVVTQATEVYNNKFEEEPYYDDTE